MWVRGAEHCVNVHRNELAVKHCLVEFGVRLVDLSHCIRVTDINLSLADSYDRACQSTVSKESSSGWLQGLFRVLITIFFMQRMDIVRKLAL